MEKVYTLSENLRIFDNGSDEIRLRVGIWNYNEAVLSLEDQTDAFKACIRDVLEKMKDGEGIALDAVKNYELSGEEENNLKGLLEGLTAAGMMCSEEERKASQQIDMAMLGEYKYYVTREGNCDNKVLFISDSSYCKKTAQQLADNMELKLELISDKLYERLAKEDLTTRVDAFGTISAEEELGKEFEKYSAILVCMHRPQVSMLRNINRIVLSKKKQMVTAFVDGPFITAFSLNPGKTGCLECFEQRTLARMQDHVSYHNFASSKPAGMKQENKGAIPLLNMLANMVISEGYMINNFGTSKLEGRVFNVYVPSLEIQVEDLLRVPFCAACGNVSKAEFSEMNISSRRILDNIVNKISKQ